MSGENIVGNLVLLWKKSEENYNFEKKMKVHFLTHFS